MLRSAALMLWFFATPLFAAEPTPLFNGRDFAGLSTWLKESKTEDPQRVFQVSQGQLHFSGSGDGYLATNEEYRNYHLVVEYRWGEKHQGKYVRNSGILLHATGKPGGEGGAWQTSIECQLAQGCVGDVIRITGKDEQGREIPRFTAETELAPDKRRHRYMPGGKSLSFPPTRGQFWWSQHDWDFEELLDTRGRNDLESKVGEWNRVECIALEDTLTIKVNGQTVNHVTQVEPQAGKILLQTEGSEIWFRKFELTPIEPEAKTEK